MRVLILSCNTGEGHNSSSRAIKNAFQDKHIECEIEDALSFISPAFSKVISWGHVQLYRHAPKIFRSGYQYAEDHGSFFSEQANIYKMLTSGSEEMYHFIQENKYDTVISTHVFASLMVTEVLRKYPLKIRTGFVATDYTCSPTCEESILDVYFIPDSTLKEEFISCGVPEEKLFSSGIPIHKDFFSKVDKGVARKNIGVSEEGRHLVIMSGSMGCGPIRQLVELLAARLPENCYISVICGTNDKLRQKLEKDYRDYPHVYIYGYRKDISMFMDSADLYLTKPGGISTSEAAQKKLPMVFVNAVAGCETYNMNFFVKRGSAVTADTTEELASLTISLLSDAEQLDKMKSSFDSWNTQSPAEIICNYYTERVWNV